jgi:hypothetical protein
MCGRDRALLRSGGFLFGELRGVVWDRRLSKMFLPCQTRPFRSLVCFSDVEDMDVYLQLHRICVVTLPCKHGHGVVKNGTSTLHTLIQPTRAILFLINRDRESLATTVVYAID